MVDQGDNDRTRESWGKKHPITVAIIASLVAPIILGISSKLAEGVLIDWLGGVTDKELETRLEQVVGKEGPPGPTGPPGPKGDSGSLGPQGPPGLGEVIPYGVVLAFDLPETTGCPPGWNRFTSAAGRMIIGAGPHYNRDRNGQPLARYRPGDFGGEEKHKLSVDEMPAHTHGIQVSKSIEYSQRRSDTWARTLVSGPEIRYPKMAGKGKPHNNMPPYTALNFCKKVVTFR